MSPLPWIVSAFCAVASSPALASGGGAAMVQNRIVIEQSLAVSEYRASANAAGVLQAPNRAHDLLVTFGAEGIDVAPRTRSGRSFEWGLRLTRVSRCGVEAILPPSTLPIRIDDRVLYRREEIDEWYVNDSNGLEQGFTFARRPEGDGDLTLELAVIGSLSPIERDGGIDFVDDAGAQQLRYDHLSVVDADGRAIVAALAVVDRGVRVIVDDRGAHYPLTIDPLTTSAVWIGTNTQPSAAFGACVATAGDVNADGFSDVLIGAPLFDAPQFDEGIANLYLGSPNWPNATAAWRGESNQANAHFGGVLGPAGDVNGDGFADVVIAAPSSDQAGAPLGAAYVFHGNSTGLSATFDWTVVAPVAHIGFATAVGTAGDVNDDGFSDVIVGAPRYSFGNQHPTGGVFEFNGSPAGLAMTASWSFAPPFAYPGDAFFGGAVATAGDTNCDGYSDVLVGSTGYHNAFIGELGEGGAYTFCGSSTGLGSAPASIVESNEAGAGLGFSVSSAGDVDGDGFSDVIAGALGHDSPVDSNVGEAMLFRGSVASVETTPLWTFEGENPNPFGNACGDSVATAGDVNGDGYSDVLVSDPSFDRAHVRVGRAMCFFGSSTGPVSPAGWAVNGPFTDQGYARDLAGAGDVNGDGFSDVIVGAPFWSDSMVFGGRALLYAGSADGLRAPSDPTCELDAANAAVGGRVAQAGDTNGDGFTDVVIGAAGFDGDGNDEGRALLYLGTPTGIAASPSWSVESHQAGASLGSAASCAGDVNGDGFSDVVIGADGFDAGQLDEGRAWVYLGSAAALAATATWVAESNQVGARFGASAATAGDVNGDGFSDLVIGAPEFTNGETGEGRAFVYLGSVWGLGSSAAWSGESDRAGAHFGRAVGSAGDVNGDGFSDVAIGAPGFGNGESGEGGAFVYLGSLAGLSSAAAWHAEGNQVGAEFGADVACAGDVNRDGFSDVIIGAPSFTNGELSEGRASVFVGSAVGLSGSPKWISESNQSNANYGRSVASGGDVDGDGFSDVIVGAPTFTNGEAAEGSTFVYRGSANGPASSPAWIFESNQPSARYGESVSTAGDASGDGYSDVVVGAPGFDNGQIDEGAVFFYAGGGGPGKLALPRQRRADDSSPVAPLGQVTGSSFVARMRARSPLGREDARIAVEVKKLSVPFNGVGITTSSAADTGLDGVEATATVVGLALGEPFKWRARVLHDRVKNPILPSGPWFSPPSNGSTETDLRSGSLALAVPYGTGKAGTNGVPALSSTKPPVLGSTSDLTISNGRPGAWPIVLFAGFETDSLPFDEGLLLVKPVAILLFATTLDSAGAFSIPVALPSDPLYVGTSVYFQALFPDSGSTGYAHTAQTNGLHWMLGN